MKHSIRIAFLAVLLAAPLGAAAASCPQNTWAGSHWTTWNANAFTLSGAMAYVGGTGNKYFHSTSAGGNTNDNGSIPDCATYGCADYSFTLTAADAGYYKFTARTFASDGSHDSLFVGIVGQNDTCSGGGGSSGSPAIRRWDIAEDGSNYVDNYVTDWDNNNSFGAARVWYLGAGTYTLRFIGREPDVRVRQVDVYRMLVVSTPTPTPIVTPPALGTGLCASYYDGTMSFAGTPRPLITDPTINFNWGAGYAITTTPKVGPDNFSVRWTGQIEFPLADNYILYSNTDDGVRVYLGGTLIIDHWVNQSVTEWASAPISITRPGKVDLTFEYFENGGNAQCELRWESGAIPKQIVPQGRLYVCGGGGPAPTTTRTPVASTPTRTPVPPPTIWAGLPASERLNGLEYIPFPECSLGGNTFYGLAVTFTSAANNNIGRNTARWRIEFQGLVDSVGNQVRFETRIGAAGEDCTTGNFEPSAYASATSLTLPNRPQNISNTYCWVDGNVPITERFDAVGDPRYVPYVDTIGAASAANDLAGGYNWFYKDLRTNSRPDYQAEYLPFLPNAIYERYNGQPNYDVPKLFALWREGVVITHSIYTSMTGWSSYYSGIGGEIGGDSANKLGNGPGVICYKGPWGGSGSAGQEEIIGSATYVRTASWISRPTLGELWPDSLYASDWYNLGGNATWGNLRNNQQGGQAYRQALESLASPDYSFPQVQHRTSSQGCGTFMNNGTSTGNVYNHTGYDYDANLMWDGTQMARDYNFSMPSTFHVNRPWSLTMGNSQPEFALQPYSGRRLNLTVYSASTAQSANNWGFYDYNAGTTQRASAAVRGMDLNGVLDPDGAHSAGWFVMNGLAPSTDSGINFVARFAILSCLRTFHDAGVPTTNGNTGNRYPTTGATFDTFRIPPVPLVKIYFPPVGVAQTGKSTVLIKWTERYARWDDKRYTENYPCLDQDSPPCSAGDPSKADNPALEWHDSTVLNFNLKYSMDGGGTWFSCLTGDPAQAGVPMDGANAIAPTASHLYEYNWDVSALPAGYKLVRVEAYRPSLPLHYTYHELQFQTAP